MDRYLLRIRSFPGNKEKYNYEMVGQKFVKKDKKKNPLQRNGFLILR